MKGNEINQRIKDFFEKEVAKLHAAGYSVKSLEIDRSFGRVDVELKLIYPIGEETD